MRCGTVAFHAYPEFLIQIVEVPVAGALADPRLPVRCQRPLASRLRIALGLIPAPVL
jgi:hypothetical protein